MISCARPPRVVSGRQVGPVRNLILLGFAATTIILIIIGLIVVPK